jgi:hypothetical protein
VKVLLDQMVFDRNFNWPNDHLNKTTFDRTPIYHTPFDQMPSDQKLIWPIHHLVEGSGSFHRIIISTKTLIKPFD